MTTRVCQALLFCTSQSDATLFSSLADHGDRFVSPTHQRLLHFLQLGA